MVIKVHTITTKGLLPIAVDVDIQTSRGIPKVIILGMVSSTIKEAKDRITSALKQIGFRLKARRTVINLSPVEIKKNGSSYDLAIACGLLALDHKLAFSLHDVALVGAVNLDGSVSSIDRCLSLVIAAIKLGFKKIIVPKANLVELKLITGIQLLPITHIKQLITGESLVPQQRRPKLATTKKSSRKAELLSGQAEVMRAITISLAGSHHLVVVGPPGVGKSLLANTVQQLQSNLSLDEQLIVASLCQLANINHSSDRAPFRTPHHSSSWKTIFGSAHFHRPGEVSLAHHGVLFMDELPEFAPKILTTLRSVIDDNQVILNSATDTCSFPADCTIIATANPCPCGYWQSGVRTCRCTTMQRKKFVAKVPGPLLDRFPLHCLLQPPAGKSATVETIQLDTIFTAIEEAHQRQSKRYQSLTGTYKNSQISLSQSFHYLKASAAAQRLLSQAQQTLHLSSRGYLHTLLVAQTIADLDQLPLVTEEAVAEALSYRFEQQWQ